MEYDNESTAPETASRHPTAVAPGPPRPPAPRAPEPPADRARDRSPDAVFEDVDAWTQKPPAPGPGGDPPRLERARSAPSGHSTSCTDLSAALARAHARAPKMRKSVSFHNTVALVRSESLTDLPADEKHRIWYRSTDYSRFVHSELGRRREMGVTSTSLIMPTSIAHYESPGVIEESDESDQDEPMDDWQRYGSCDSDAPGYSDADTDEDEPGSSGPRPEDAAAPPVRLVG